MGKGVRESGGDLEERALVWGSNLDCIEKLKPKESESALQPAINIQLSVFFFNFLLTLPYSLLYQQFLDRLIFSSVDLL